MRDLSSRNVDVSDRAQAELKNARKRIDELSAEMNRLISQVTTSSIIVLLHKDYPMSLSREVIYAAFLWARNLVVTRLEIPDFTVRRH